MAKPNPTDLISNLAIPPDNAKKLTPAAAKLTYADLQSIEAAFKDQDKNLAANPQADLGCCCCCCSAASMPAAS